VAMTSNPAGVEYGFRIDSPDLESGSLNHPGTVCVDKIYALSQSLVVKTFGRVNSGVLERIRSLIHDLLARRS
jgi:mRNA interferase MazF